ncbi:MAG TPA: DUF507 family protein [Candidatus Eisenbacteria bacterium]|nr:DUF507 family protein [Candidatus Eisenbacteria bacterium]
MRLTEAKIRQLAAKIAGELGQRDDISLTASSETIEAEVARVVRENLIEEDALDREVETMLGRYRKEIASGNLDVGVLRQKIKKQLAKERGVVF